MNKTEVTKVFEEYVVDETAGAVEGYAGIITGAKVEKSLASNGVISYNDYTIAVNVLVDENGELKQYKKYYRNILTRGRNHFQNLISDFELIKEENGNPELRLNLLLGRICEVTFGMTNCIKNITIPGFEDEETKDEITAILKKEADIADTAAIDRKIEAQYIYLNGLAASMQQFIRENAMHPQGEDFYDTKLAEYEKQRAEGETRLKDLQSQKAARLSRKELLDGLVNALEESGILIDKFDERLWRLMVEKATVDTDGKLTFTLRNGMEIEV